MGSRIVVREGTQVEAEGVGERKDSKVGVAFDTEGAECVECFEEESPTLAADGEPTE